MTDEPIYPIFIPGIGNFPASKSNPLPRHYRALRDNIDDRQKFWQAADWPDDVRNRVFLGRAVHQLGRAMFGADWTGHEPTVDGILKPLPMFSFGLRPWEVAQATKYLEREQLDLSTSDWAAKVHAMHQPKWDAAVALRSEVLAAIAGPRARLSAVQDALRLAMRDGELKYFVLISETGKFQGPLDPDSWNTKLYPARFYWCAINLDTPITPAVGGGGFRPIFVDADDLVVITAAFTKGKPGNKAIDDEDAVAEMVAIMDAEGVSATEAAKRVAPKAKGNGVERSTARRLFGKFKDAHPARVEARFKD